MGASNSKYKVKRSRTPVTASPSPPGKPTLKNTPGDNYDSDVVTITWNPPLFDGGSKITGYLIEQKRTSSPHWVKATPVKVRGTELRLSGLEPGWRYQFRAFAENAVGISAPSALSEPLAISVNRSAAVAPYFITELHDIVALENEKVEFTTYFEGVPSPKIVWYKDGLEIFSNRRQRICTEDNCSSFLIHELSLSDECEIKCSATNRVGHSVTKARLKVQAAPSIRLSRQYEEGLLFEEGETIRLKVLVVGRPSPSVTWFHNGELLALENNRYEVAYSDKMLVLKIKEARRSDRGEYQIRAVNTLGQDIASVMVTIANRPQPPVQINVDAISTSHVKLSWTVPTDDGGCKISSYIVEYFKLGWDIWLKAATSRQTHIKLEDLIEGSKYKFRVKAENPYGVSDPSPESDLIYVPWSERLTCQNNEQSSGEDFKQFENRAESEISANSKIPPEKPQRQRKMENRVSQERVPIPKICVEASSDSDESASEAGLKYIRKRHSMDRICEGVVAPPISLSAPELGNEEIMFKPLRRNCVSSTELLHDSNTARIYMYKTQDQSLSSKGASTGEKPDDNWRRKFENIPPHSEDKRGRPDHQLPAPSSNWSIMNDHADFYNSEDEDESEELSGLGYDSSSFTAEEETPLSFERAAEISRGNSFRRNSSPTNEKFLESDLLPNNKNPAAMVHKSNLKPILKRGSSPSNPVHPSKHYNSSVHFVEDEKKLATATLPKAKPYLEPRPYETDAPKVAIDHYSSIVKRYGNATKANAKTYLTYEELKAAAQMEEKLLENSRSPLLSTTPPRLPTPTPKSPLKFAGKDGGEAAESTSARKKTADEELRIRRARNKVRFFFDFTLDVTMLACACWLYCFRDERLAVPILVLLVYRQICDGVKRRFRQTYEWGRTIMDGVWGRKLQK